MRSPFSFLGVAVSLVLMAASVFLGGCSGAPAASPDPLTVLLEDAALVAAQAGLQAAQRNGDITPQQYAAAESILAKANADIVSGNGVLTNDQILDLERTAVQKAMALAFPVPAASGTHPPKR